MPQEVTQFKGDIELVQELPGGDKIKLDLLEGWEELEEGQKIWLSQYFETFPQRLKTCMDSGIKTHVYQSWLKNDQPFNQVLELIEDLHAECLSAVQYRDSYANSKVRSKTLQALNARGYEKKSQSEHKHIHIGENSLKGYLDKN